MGNQKVNIGFVTLVSGVAAVGGLLFGFDTAVISGAIGFLQEHFALSAAMMGWVVSSLLIGCIIGAAFAGPLSDRLGRKKVMILAAFLFTVASIGSALPETVTMLVLARILGGVAVGLTSALSPVYIAEIAPAQLRGRLVALNQLAIVTGISAVFFVNLAVASSGTHEWNVTSGWRWMLGFGAVPGLAFLLLLFLVPESPRWLEQKGHSEKALAILSRVNGRTRAEQELKEIRATISSESGTFRDLFTKRMKMPLFVGIALAILQQITGINAVMYYAPEIFKEIGSGTDTALTQTVMVGLVNLVFTLVSIWLIDKVGRKALMLVGSASMTVCLLVIGYAFASGNTSGSWVLIFILLYVASFAISLGPVVWVVIAEIFPTRIRGLAVSVSSVALWAADYLVSQMFPIMISSIGPAVTFFVFMITSAITVLFTIKFMPETKGKTLEQIEQSWR